VAFLSLPILFRPPLSAALFAVRMPRLSCLPAGPAAPGRLPSASTIASFLRFRLHRLRYLSFSSGGKSPGPMKPERLEQIAAVVLVLVSQPVRFTYLPAPAFAQWPPAHICRLFAARQIASSIHFFRPHSCQASGRAAPPPPGPLYTRTHCPLISFFIFCFTLSVKSGQASITSCKSG